MDALAAAANAEGMVYASEAGTYQEGSGGYTLACEGADAAGHATFGLSVTYWTLDGVSEIYLSVTSDTPGAVVSPAAPIKIMSSIADLSAGDIAKTWVVDHLGDSACSPRCTNTYGGVQIELQTGSNGGRGLHVTAAAT